MKSLILHEPDLSAFIAGNKTQLRIPYLFFQNVSAVLPPQTRPMCPVGEPGSVCFIRESWRPARVDQFIHQDGAYEICEPAARSQSAYEYLQEVSPLWQEESGVWDAPEQMPLQAARNFALIEDVRLERLKDISIEDAIAEGMPSGVSPDLPAEMPVHAFAAYWDTLYGVGSWLNNPVVWVLTLSKAPRPAQ